MPFSTQVKRYSGASHDSDDNGRSDDDFQQQQQQRRRQPPAQSSAGGGIFHSQNIYLPSRHRSSSDSEGKQEYGNDDDGDEEEEVYGDNNNNRDERNNNDDDGGDDDDDDEKDIEAGGSGPPTTIIPRRRRTRFSLESLLSRVTEDDDDDDDRSASNSSPLATANANANFRHSLRMSQRSSLRSEQSSDGSSCYHGEAASGSASGGGNASMTTGEQQQQQQQQQQPRPRKISFAAKFLPRLSYDSAAGSLDDSSSNAGASCAPQHNNNNNNNNPNLSNKSIFNTHNNPQTNINANSNPHNHSPYHRQLSATSLATRKYRRYSVREYVLISNHNCLHPNKLVNIHGYPSWWWNPHLGGKGNPSAFSKSSPERRGPYCYLLAQVVSVHFEEDAQYYTVTREDDREKQRADAEWMEPIKESEGLEAAKAAARRRDDVYDDRRREAKTPFRRRGGIIGTLAWLCFCGWMHGDGYSARRRAGSSKCGRMVKRVLRWVRREADRCLNGQRPYGMEVRVTGVNLLVGCGVWYLFVDQLRLAFFPHSADFALAVVSCIVWLILFFELIFEIFIRPDKYSTLVRSDKAYLPSTVRYLSTIQFFLELIPLAFFIPEFICIFDSDSCGSRRPVTLATCSVMSVYGPTRLDAFYGRAFLCIMRLRIFGLVRHWKKMWVNNTFVMKKNKTGEWRIERGRGLFVPQGHRNWGMRGETSVIPLEESHHYKSAAWLKSKKDVGAAVEEGKGGINGTSTDDYHLTNASNIGTALLTTNTERGLLLVFFISMSSLIRVACMDAGGTNQQLVSSVKWLQANNLAADNTRNETCDFLRETVFQWVASNIYDGGSDVMHLLHLEIEPVRCDFQKGPDGSQSNGVIGAALCGSSEALARCEEMFSKKDCGHLCKVWSASDEQERQYYYENLFGIRPSVTFTTTDGSYGTYSTPKGEVVNDYFSVSAVFNETKAVSQSIITLFLSQLGFTLFVLLSLSVLRYDAGRLVLGPLRRMLKIVAFYAKNPLSPSPTRESTGSIRSLTQGQDDDCYDSEDENNSDKQLGTYETEQLINTVTKITDLLRKCWGVAGAGIISSNLARQEGGLTTLFNPTVPGEAVYALFAFVAIDKFQHHLHCLKGDIMILINDIAAVLHEEVYRWGYEDRGQCNKNLGGAFLMVYRIGTVAEVLEKRDRAEAVIFSAKGKQSTVRKRRRSGQQSSNTRTSSSNSRNGRSVDSIDLSSLPGIRSFTDRAILGLLKTFAGIHRDATLLKWQSDFRLGAGVHATSIELIFGMDAGWAVEGAVGSSYKIDATYLSPHVNMASRMMSATKQYGVFFLFSQAVQGLLSDNAKDKLRHIDTVTVKGSSVQQKIFTYDAKVRSDFFLYSKTEDQADLDSERYSPAIWDTDQDIVAMRNHIDDDFIRVFNRGRDEYLAGNWPKAISLLKKADRIMFDREVDEGYVSHVPNDNMRSLSNVLDTSDVYDDEYYHEEGEDKVTRLALGDGPCQRLIAYMTEMGGEAPDNWAGYRPLTSK